MRLKKLTFALLLSIGAPMAQANLVSDPGFENGGFSGGSNGGFGPFLTFSNGFSFQGWQVGLGGINLWTNYNSTGNHVVDIIGNSQTEGGTLSQNLATQIGTTYLVSFDLGGSGGQSAVKTMDVSIFNSNNSLVSAQHYQQDTSALGGALTLTQFSFVAQDTTSKLLFRGTNSGFDGFYLDNVSVNAVPVPAPVWLLGSALAGIGLRARGSRARKAK